MEKRKVTTEELDFLDKTAIAYFSNQNCESEYAYVQAERLLEERKKRYILEKSVFEKLKDTITEIQGHPRPMHIDFGTKKSQNVSQHVSEILPKPEIIYTPSGYRALQQLYSWEEIAREYNAHFSKKGKESVFIRSFIAKSIETETVKAFKDRFSGKLGEFGVMVNLEDLNQVNIIKDIKFLEANRVISKNPDDYDFEKIALRFKNAATGGEKQGIFDTSFVNLRLPKETIGDFRIRFQTELTKFGCVFETVNDCAYENIVPIHSFVLRYVLAPKENRKEVLDLAYECTKMKTENFEDFKSRFYRFAKDKGFDLLEPGPKKVKTLDYYFEAYKLAQDELDRESILKIAYEDFSKELEKRGDFEARFFKMAAEKNYILYIDKTGKWTDGDTKAEI